MPCVDARRLPTRHLLAWMAVAAALVYIAFFGGALNFMPSPQARILTHLVILAAAITTVILIARGRVSVGSPLVAPGIAYVAVMVAAALVSQRPAASIEAVAIVLVAAPTYLLVRYALTLPWLEIRIDWLVIVGTATFVALYLFQALSQWAAWWAVAGPSVPPLRSGNVALTLGSLNTVSLYLELLVPSAVALSWMRWRRRWFTVGLAVAAVAALVITGSRGGWLGAAAGILVMLVFVARDERASAWIHRLRSVRPSVAVVGLVALVSVAIALGPLLATRLLSGDAGRGELWSAAWSIFTSHPLLGAGPGSWQSMRALEPISVAHLALLPHAHQVFLHVAAETGLAGLAAVAWFLIRFVRLAVDALRSAPTREARLVRQVTVASLVAFGAHSQVDTQLHLPGVILLVMLLVARLDPAPLVPATPVASGRGTVPATTTAAAGAAATVIVGVALLVPIDLAMTRAAFGSRALDAGRPAEALAQYEGAAALHELPVYRLGEAIARSRLGDMAGTRDALVRFVDGEPFTFALASLAVATDATGDRAATSALLDAIERAGPYDPAAMLQVAILRGRLGDTAASVQALTQVMVAVPSLVHSARPAALFDEATWTQAQVATLGRLAAGSPATASAAARHAGLDDLATEYAASVPPGPSRTLLDEIANAVEGRAVDLEAARAILRANPDSPEVLGLHWDLALTIGSQEDLKLVAGVSTLVIFDVPPPWYEIVVDGAVDSEAAIRLPRYPMAASSRVGPHRIYIAGFATIEPVVRPTR
jgi:O-antigen ligase